MDLDKAFEVINLLILVVVLVEKLQMIFQRTKSE